MSHSIQTHSIQRMMITNSCSFQSDKRAQVARRKRSHVRQRRSLCLPNPSLKGRAQTGRPNHYFGESVQRVIREDCSSERRDQRYRSGNKQNSGVYPSGNLFINQSIYVRVISLIDGFGHGGDAEGVLPCCYLRTRVTIRLQMTR